MATGIYNAYKKLVLSPANMDLLSGNVKVALMAPSYTPDFDAEQYYQDVIAGEVSGIGYTAGGQNLQNPSVVQNNTNNTGDFDADDLQWPGSTITARGLIAYEDTGNPATSRLIGYIDFGSNMQSNGGTFTIQWQTLGILIAS